MADAHGSGPCEVKLMQVQVLFLAPQEKGYTNVCSFLYGKGFERSRMFCTTKHVTEYPKDIKTSPVSHTKVKKSTFLCILFVLARIEIIRNR